MYSMPQALAAVLCALACCLPPGAAGEPRTGAEGHRLRVVGSSAMAPLVADLARSFEASHPGVSIDVQEGGSGRGLAEATQGRADIGMVSRTLTAQEAGLFSFLVARDGVGLVVHKANPVAALAREQVQAIYTGRVTNWKQVGGRDLPITVITAAPDYGAVDLFMNHFGIPRGELKAHLRLGDNAERIAAVASTPGAVAFTSVGSAEQAMRASRPVRTLPLEGKAATLQNIRADNYPLVRPLLLVTRAAPTGLARYFINYVQSPHAAEAVRRRNLVPDGE